MSRREVVIDRIEHRETDFCPYTLDFEVDSNLEPLIDEYYGSREWRVSYKNYILKTPGMPDGRDVWQAGPAYRTDFFGTVWRMDLGRYRLAIDHTIWKTPGASRRDPPPGFKAERRRRIYPFVCKGAATGHAR